MRENARFAGALRDSPLAERVAATFGLHASMTLSDETLEACRAESNRFHVHVAEHQADAWDSLGRSGKRTVERLHDFGVTGVDIVFTSTAGRWPC